MVASQRSWTAFAPKSRNPLIVLDQGAFDIDEIGEIGGIGEIVGIAIAWQ